MMVKIIIPDEASFTPREVARILKVSRRTVRRLIDEGRLGGIHVTRFIVRIPRAEVERIVTNGTFKV